MCTSLALPSPDGTHLFGRTLDLNTHFGEAVTLTPRRYPFTFDGCPPLPRHYALLGMATVMDSPATRGYPLYAEAMNEAGLCMAGLRFSESAAYADPAAPAEGKLTLAPWELIPYLLGQFSTLEEVRAALGQIRVVNRPFSTALPAAPLHWHMADADPNHGGLILEVTSEGMRLYDADAGVLTNEPPYPAQLAFLQAAPDRLPGGYDSTARFTRAATLRRWWLERGSTPAAEDGTPQTTDYAVAQFFSLLGAVSPTAGAVMTENGCCHRTLYTCCMDTAAGVYSYKTERDAAVRSVGFGALDLNGDRVVAVEG